MKEIFTDIYKKNDWKNDESVSGNGSTLDATEGVRRELPRLFAKFHVKSLLDIPCGDCNWIKGYLHQKSEYVHRRRHRGRAN
jgi:hypothetical protein